MEDPDLEDLEVKLYLSLYFRITIKNEKTRASLARKVLHDSQTGKINHYSQKNILKLLNRSICVVTIISYRFNLKNVPTKICKVKIV